MMSDLVDAGYRALTKKVHPDTAGGSTEGMQRLNRARETLRGLIRNW
jgi:curved DNA-binding protein CbpA